MRPEAARCLTCGSKSVIPRQAPGRTRVFRVFPSLAVPDDFMIPTCGRCRAEYPDKATNAALDRVLSGVYRRELRRQAANAINHLALHMRQRPLELLLGLAQGYLSRLAAGKGNPSAQLVLLLRSLADSAPESLEAVRRYWAMSPYEEEIDMVTKKRLGFAAMNKEKHQEIARRGGRAAQEQGLARTFSPSEASEAGKKGGSVTSANRGHMAAIGQKGASSRRTKVQIARFTEAPRSREDTIASELAARAIPNIQTRNRTALAALLGLSRVTLQELTKGELVPARPLLALLHLLSARPELVAALEAFWSDYRAAIQVPQTAPDLPMVSDG